MKLLDEAKARLAAATGRGRSLRSLADKSGGAVEREWLYKFASGEIGEPSVNRIQALRDYLAGLPEGRLEHSGRPRSGAPAEHV